MEEYFDVNAFLRYSLSPVSRHDLYHILYISPILNVCLFSMAQNYGYETLMTELPTYMKQVLRFSIKTVSSLVRGRWILRCFDAVEWRN